MPPREVTGQGVRRSEFMRKPTIKTNTKKTYRIAVIMAAGERVVLSLRTDSMNNGQKL